MDHYVFPVDPAEAARSVCGYMGSTPGQWACGNKATWHLWVVNDAIDDGSALACDEHVAVARVAAVLVDEHAFGGCCGLPGTIWDFDNHCCFVDFCGVEATARAAQRVCV